MDLSFLGIKPQMIQGHDLSKVKLDHDRVLIYDGDAACYVHSAGVAHLATAQRRLEQDILTTMYLAKCSSARVHLTPHGCAKNGRMRLIGAKSYQTNRVGKTAPPLLRELRDTAFLKFKDHPDFLIIPNYELEADDGCMIDAYTYQDNGVLVSFDKDLNLNPFESYNVNTGQFERLPKGDTFGWFERKEIISPISQKAKMKCYGKGTKFFFAQLLMGDTADNVKGLLKYNGKLIGEAGAANVLEGIHTAEDAANLIVDAYRKIDQNIIPEAHALWLLRSEDDSAYQFLKECNLSPENTDFVDTCFYDRKWSYTPEEFEELKNATN